MDASIGIPKNIAKIAGPLLLGYLLAWGLFGTLSMQVYIYYLAFAKDPRWIRAAIFSLYVFQTVQICLLSQSAFMTFGPGFGKVESVDDIQHIWFSVPIMSSVVAFVVQMFYAQRIRVMARDIRIPFVITLLSAIQLAGGITTGVLAQRAIRFSRFFDTETLITTGIWNGAGALCNVIIACCMIYFYSSRNSTWKLNSTRVPVLVKIVVQSGCLLAVVTIINTAFCFLTHGETFFETSSAILGNTYANTLLAVFNSRVSLLRSSEIVNIGGHASHNFHSEIPMTEALMFAAGTTARDPGTHVGTEEFETVVQDRRSTDTGTVVSEDLERWNEEWQHDTSREDGTSNSRSSIELARV